jgi:hypothetical protein
LFQRRNAIRVRPTISKLHGDSAAFQEDHTMRKITKRSAVIVTAAVVAVGGAGAAFAAWSLNSSKDASTVAGKATPLNVTNLQIAGTLVPGTPVSVKFDAANPNSFPVAVSNITFSDIRTSNPSACPANNLVPNPDATLPTGMSFGASGSETASKNITYANALQLKADPDDACQNATFAFKVNLVVASTNA